MLCVYLDKVYKCLCCVCVCVCVCVLRELRPPPHPPSKLKQLLVDVLLRQCVAGSQASRLLVLGLARGRTL